MNRALAIPAGCCLVLFASTLAALHHWRPLDSAAVVRASEPQFAVARRDVAQPSETAAHELWAASADHSYSARSYSGRNDSGHNDSDASQALLPPGEGKQILTALAGEYMRPWRQWESSPHRLYSRAAPRPIPSMSAQIQLVKSDAPDSSAAHSPGDPFLLATIAITTGRRTQPIPCVMDRTTRQVRLFADGQWVTADQWLQSAPLP